MLARGEVPRRINPLATMPSEEPERTSEAIRRALPELIKLVRYESRAAARRDKAIRQITLRRAIAARSSHRSFNANVKSATVL